MPAQQQPVMRLVNLFEELSNAAANNQSQETSAMTKAARKVTEHPIAATPSAAFAYAKKEEAHPAPAAVVGGSLYVFDKASLVGKADEQVVKKTEQEEHSELEECIALVKNEGRQLQQMFEKEKMVHAMPGSDEKTVKKKLESEEQDAKREKNITMEEEEEKAILQEAAKSEMELTGVHSKGRNPESGEVCANELEEDADGYLISNKAPKNLLDTFAALEQGWSWENVRYYMQQVAHFVDQLHSGELYRNNKTLHWDIPQRCFQGFTMKDIPYWDGKTVSVYCDSYDATPEGMNADIRSIGKIIFALLFRISPAEDEKVLSYLQSQKQSIREDQQKGLCLLEGIFSCKSWTIARILEYLNE